MGKGQAYNIGQLRGAWGAGRAAAEKAIEANRSLEGKFFHTMPGGDDLGWQGRVLSAQPQDYFLVQLYSWWNGEPTRQALIKFSDMLTWHFYQTQDDWRYAAAQFNYERHGGSPPEEALEVEKKLDELSRPTSRKKRKDD